MSGQSAEVIDLASYRAARAAAPVPDSSSAMQPVSFGMVWVPMMLVPCWFPMQASGQGSQQAV